MLVVPLDYDDYSTELEIKRSRFITHLTRSDDEAAAREHIHTVKSLYPDARHHCSAFYLSVPDAQPIERSSDDGEPSGTAGNPMLDVLRGSGMMNVCAVVVRYFGGIKLGTGGLVSAYSDAVREVLPQVPRAERWKAIRAEVRVDVTDAGRVEAELRRRGVTVVDTQYSGVWADIACAVSPDEGVEQLTAQLQAISAGRLEATATGELWYESALG